jgi:hypothetical protein
MSRQQFGLNNRVGQTLTFQKSGATPSFDPTVTMTGSKRVSYNFGDGIQTAGNSVSYNGYTSDYGIRTITVKTNSLKDIQTLNFFDDILYGNLNISGLTSLTSFNVASNPLLTGITNPISSNIYTGYDAWFCNIIGTLDLSTLTNLGGVISIHDNSNLENIIFPSSNQIITKLWAFQCKLKGNLILTGFTNLGADLDVSNNPQLTGITHTFSNQNFIGYKIWGCNIIGTHDVSMLTNLGGPSSGSTCNFDCSFNFNLINILFPTVNTFFRNTSNSINSAAFKMNYCNLDYVDFKPLSGITLVSGTTQGSPIINLESNSISTGDINHILDDFLYNTTNNPSGWSNVRLYLFGNSTPDSSSGGYDGITAISSLTGSPYNWSVTY